MVKWQPPEAPPAVEEPVAPAAVPALPPVPVEEALQLTGVAWNERGPLAFVNGSVCAQGDQIGRFRVQHVYRDRIVVVDSAGVEYIVLLYKE